MPLVDATAARMTEIKRRMLTNISTICNTANNNYFTTTKFGNPTLVSMASPGIDTNFTKGCPSSSCIVSPCLAVLVYRCLCGTAPSYLADELRRVSDMPARQLRLRSASTAALDVPVTRRSTIGDRSFSVAAARVWNSLPADLTSASSPLVDRTVPS